MSNDTKMLMFFVPEDSQVLAALGKVTLRQEHLNHILKMTIRSLAGLTVKEAIDATHYEGSSALMTRIRKLARKRIGEGEALLRLQALLMRAGRLTARRNELVHGLWAQELDGNPGVMFGPGKLHALPATNDLEELSEEIHRLTRELNFARLEGFLKEALERSATDCSS